jgi:chaperone required for assembly of F1-ATPase
MLGSVLAHIPWNAISNLELQRLYKALRDDLVLPPAATLSNICQRESALTVDAIKKQLPIRNKVSIALDGWISTNKLVITSVIAYYMDRNWALCEVQPAFDEVDRLFCSHFES